MTDWSKSLYTFGYLLTDDPGQATERLAFLNEWKSKFVNGYTLFVHNEQKFYICEKSDRTFLLVGHAYNPFSMERDENDILKHLSDFAYGSERYRDYFDQLTGVFFFAVIDKDTISATCDCAGMLGANYAVINGNKCFSAYSQMIAEIYGLTEDPYITKLKRSKLFHWYGWYLPGDLTPYQEVKRIVPNTETVIRKKASVNRFYPRKKYSEVGDESYEEQVKNICTIMNNNLRIAAEKWKSPAISLTGGTDSKTTLACAKGVQERFSYFSYVSLPREENDALAAKQICEALGLEHRIFTVDPDPSAYEEYEEVSALINRHYSYLGKANANDVCKRIVLKEQFDYDVEVKSWVSEVARASRYRRYGKKKFPDKIRPRMLTSMYKLFAFDRGNALRTDKKFNEYLEKTGLRQAIDDFGYPWTEFFVWEIVFGGWGGLALTGEHMLTNEITVPYNNRALLEMMLRTPLEKRMHDDLHKDMIRLMDDRIEKLGIHVVNGNETKQREMLERIYYNINNLLPW
ncbi:MAG: hypothetical protein J5586_03395 [Clostridia bacterium]|nr:hypothetical protein [Clostridia bacterium]